MACSDRVGRIVAQWVLAAGNDAIGTLLVAAKVSRPRLAALVEDSPWMQQVARLRCLRGIDTLSALGLCAELGDLHRSSVPPD